MSTRATIHFKDSVSAKPTAIIYRHSDGYPEGLGADLQAFVAQVKANCPDTRFTDAAYLAAKWVVYDADLHKRGEHQLSFLSVGVVNEDPGDIEYRYWVICNGTPTIFCETAKGEARSMPQGVNLI